MNDEEAKNKKQKQFHEDQCVYGVRACVFNLIFFREKIRAHSPKMNACACMQACNFCHVLQ